MSERKGQRRRTTSPFLLVSAHFLSTLRPRHSHSPPVVREPHRSNRGYQNLASTTFFVKSTVLAHVTLLENTI